jgi:hypothetical protein
VDSAAPDNPDSPAVGVKRGAISVFLNSSLGVLLVGSLIGAIGVYTWQRQDWLFKEKYYRSQVMVDRRLNLVEQINRDTGRFITAANDVIAVYSKQVTSEQTKEAVQAYNKEQAEWFGSYGSHQALLAFYFPENDISASFAAVVDSSEELDRLGYYVSTGAKPLRKLRKFRRR